MKTSNAKAKHEELLTINQVSGYTDIPVSSLRKYCKQFRQNLDLKRGDKNSILFDRANIDRLVLVRKLFSEGLPAHEVKKTLLKVVNNEQPPEVQTPKTSLNKVPDTLHPSAMFDTLLPHDVTPHEYKPIVKLLEEQKAKISDLEKAQEQQTARINELEKTVAELSRPRSLREIIFQFLKAINAIPANRR